MSDTWLSWLSFGFWSEQPNGAAGRNVPNELSNDFPRFLGDPKHRAIFVVTTPEDLQEVRRNLRPVGLPGLHSVPPPAPEPPENPYCLGHQFPPNSPLRELHRTVHKVPASC